MVLGNPAERLHQILAAFESASGASVTVGTCWKKALECSSAALPACLQSALSLIPEIRTRIVSQGLDGQLALFARYEDAWLKPFMPDRGWQQGSHSLVDTDSLLALTSLSAIFATLEPGQSIVEAEQSKTLLGLVDEARAAVRDSGDLPLDLRTVIMDRLHDVQWAVEHYRLHGADGLQAALDRLGAVMARTAKRPGAWRRKVGTALLYGWLIFSHLDDVAANLEAASTITDELVGWADDARELMAPGRLELPAANADQPADYEDSDIVDAELVEDGDDQA